MALGIEIGTGVFLLVFGLSFVINAGFWTEAFKRMFSESQQLLTFSLVLFVCGVLMVMGHNLWVGDWRVIVTIVGWSALIKSILVILAPRMLRFWTDWSESMLATGLRVGGSLWILAGGVVTYYSLAAG